MDRDVRLSSGTQLWMKGFSCFHLSAASILEILLSPLVSFVRRSGIRPSGDNPVMDYSCSLHG